MSERSSGIDVTTLLNQQEWMRSLAFRLVFDDQQADDIVQDAVMVALRSESPPIESPRAWLTTVIRNLARRGYRSQQRRDRRELKAARSERQATEDVVERAELHGLVTNEVLALEEPYRSTVLLRFFDGLKPSEIAERLDVPAATVRVRLKRALDRLRDRMDEKHDRDRTSWCLLFVTLFRLQAPPTPTGAETQTDGSALPSSSMSAAGVSLLTLGGILMTTKKLTTLLVVGILLAGISYIALYSGEEPTVQPTREMAGNTDPTRSSSDSPPPESAAVDGRSTVVPRTLAPEVVNDERRLNGRFLAADTDEPLEGISVTFVGDKTKVELRAVTDEEGSISLAAAADRYEVSVEHPTWVLASPKRLKHGPDQDAFTLRLYTGGSVVGRILDRNTREPVANANVRVVTFENWNAREATSDADGCFELKGLSIAPLSAKVTWQARGYLPAPDVNRNNIELAAGQVRDDYVLLVDRGAVVNGRVLDEAGESVVDATVRLMPRTAQVATQTTSTDADGYYELAVIPGQYHVRVTAGKLALIDGPFTIEWEGWQKDLILAPGVSLAGVLQDEHGNLLGSEHLFLRNKQTGNIDASVPTDEQGRFRISGLAAGDYDIAVRRASGSSDWQRIQLDVGEQRENAVIVVVLNRHLAIRGRLTDKEGRLAAHQSVRASAGVNIHYASTNRQGEYELLGLKDAEYTVQWRQQQRKVRSGTDGVDFDERAVKEQSVTVQVRSASGEPVHLFGSTVSQGRSRSGTLEAIDHTEPEIKFQRAFDARVEVRVEAPEVGTATLVLDPDPTGADTLVVELRLEPSREVACRVVDEDGRPVAVARIFDGAIGSYGTRELGQTLDDGTFLLQGVEEIAKVMIHHAQHAPADFEIPTTTSNEELVFRLPRGTQLSGRVHRGAAAVQADVAVNLGPLGQLQPSTNTRGEFEARVPAQYLYVSATVEVESRDVPRRAFGVQGVAVEGEDLEIDIDLPALTCTLAGTIWTGTTPISNARIRAEMHLAGGLRHQLQFTADERGEFRVDYLPAGEVVLQVLESNTKPTTSIFTKASLVARQTTTVDVQTDVAAAGAAVVSGTVSTMRQDEQVMILVVKGKVLPEQVTPQGLQALQSLSSMGQVAKDGSYEISGLAAGEYTVIALAITGQIRSPKDFEENVRFALSPVAVEEGATMTVDVALPGVAR